LIVRGLLSATRAGGRCFDISIGVSWRKFCRASVKRCADALKAVDFRATPRKRFNFERIISGTYTLDRTTETLKEMAAFEEVKPLILPRLCD
jgi:hypothetical protein